VQAALVLPPNYRGEKLPLIVNIYPGAYSFADKVNEFGTGDVSLINSQLLATRGYAVLVPDVPQHVGTPMRDLVQEVLSAVDKVIGLGYADPDRLGIVGFSYGGYSTLAVVSQSSRFKAAVMYAGFSDVAGQYLSLDRSRGVDGVSWAEGGQGLMGGSLWRLPRRYIEKSPIYDLDHVTTPLLLVHGEDDTVVHSSMSDQVFVGLRRLGREVEYRRYAGENHSLVGLEDRVDYWTAVIRWFDRYVKTSG
jgi:dipeptidyl aminopeptidase/acylaminoacyl peptidase